MPPFSSRLRLLADSLADLVVPRHCLSCRRRLAVTEHLVCPECVQSVIRFHNTDSLYERLFQWGKTGQLLHIGAFARYRREQTVAQLVHALKFYGHPELGIWMGQWAAAALQPDGFFDGVDALVPIPLSKSRHRERGYNQAEMIARGISRGTSIPVATDILVRIRNNVAQTRVGITERAANVTDVFALSPNANAEGRSLMLIDDVITTGATMASALRPLASLAGVRLSAFAWAAASV